ncbi:MAG: hypothetical protein Q8L48_19630 [Archangium sp.]|nr:hypothetical protein [Archangium sp.]
MKPSLEALFDAVYDDPGADGPRLVLADALVEVGDPRGERPHPHRWAGRLRICKKSPWPLTKGW